MNLTTHEDRGAKEKRQEPPVRPEEWLEEIRLAYADAQEAIPFGPVGGRRFGERELFHLAPAVALKFRGLPRRANLKRATEAALSSYVANLETEGAVLADPRLAFSFCYLASHYGLGFVDMAAVEGASLSASVGW